MAFFDDLGKMISQASQSTIQKGKDSAEINRLGAMIAELENTVESNYSQIGKLYVSLHPDDYASDFSGMIGTIAESEAKIREMRSQILTLKGMVSCANCGTEVSALSIYCDSCGAEMPRKKEVENLTRCSGCGQMVAKDNRFCPLCGKPMNIVMAAGTSTTEKEDEKKECPNCGAELMPGSSFCTQCGNKVS